MWKCSLFEMPTLWLVILLFLNWQIGSIFLNLNTNHLFPISLKILKTVLNPVRIFLKLSEKKIVF